MSMQINPDDVVTQFGADSLRLYEMFMGPLRDVKVWSTRSVEGVHRFLARAWRAFESGITDEPATKDQLRALHTCIKKVRMHICVYVYVWVYVDTCSTSVCGTPVGFPVTRS